MGLETSHGLVVHASSPPLPRFLFFLHIFMVAIWLHADCVMSADSSGPNACDLSDCLDLFQAAQESLQIRYDYPVPKNHTLSPEDIEARCVALRTFFHCLQNLSSLCHGGLGFHSSKKVIERQMKQLNCTTAGPVFEPLHFPHPKEPVHPAICSFMGSSVHRYCGMFGDPHLRTFNGVFQTCRIHGAWPLVDNNFFSVQVTSKAVGTGSGTAITKVTVVIKKHDDCAHDHYVTYQAMSHDLPAMFDDGQTSFGPSDSIVLTEVIPNRHVEIRLHYVSTLLVLRQHGRFLSVGILMPEELMNSTMQGRSNDLQLCTFGCSSSEQIHVAQLFQIAGKELHSSMSPSLPPSTPPPPHWHGAFDLSGAERICHGLTDGFLDSCVFDLLTTGDLNFTESDFHAYSDAMRLFPEITNELSNRTVLSKWSQAAAASSSTSAAAAGGNCYLLVMLFIAYRCLCVLSSRTSLPTYCGNSLNAGWHLNLT